MRGNGIRKRLALLEEHHAPALLLGDFPDWPVEEQLAAVADQWDFFRSFHADGRVRYSGTDREIHLLGLLCAAHALGEDGGEHAFPSGLVVTIAPEGGGAFGAHAPRPVRLEDLPEWASKHFERMSPDKQAERERWLFENRVVPFESWREGARRHEERVRARREESRRRNRELLERNRAACGLPPLTPEQLKEWGLEEPDRGEGVR